MRSAAGLRVSRAVVRTRVAFPWTSPTRKLSCASPMRNRGSVLMRPLPSLDGSPCGAARRVSRHACRFATRTALLGRPLALRNKAPGFGCRPTRLEQCGHRRAELGRRLYGARTGGLERAELVRGRPLAAGHDRAGVAHALARRRGDSGDVGHHGLGHMALNELSPRLLVATADLADHDDALGGRILLKQRKHVDEVHAAHRIATDADTGALPEPGVRRLKHSLIREGAGARNNAHGALLVDEAGHDADLALPGRDDAGAVGTYEPGRLAGKRRFHPYHVIDGDSLRDAHHELDPS